MQISPNYNVRFGNIYYVQADTPEHSQTVTSYLQAILNVAGIKTSPGSVFFKTDGNNFEHDRFILTDEEDKLNRHYYKKFHTVVTSEEKNKIIEQVKHFYYKIFYNIDLSGNTNTSPKNLQLSEQVRKIDAMPFMTKLGAELRLALPDLMNPYIAKEERDEIKNLILESQGNEIKEIVQSLLDSSLKPFDTEVDNALHNTLKDWQKNNPPNNNYDNNDEL